MKLNTPGISDKKERRMIAHVNHLLYLLFISISVFTLAVVQSADAQQQSLEQRVDSLISKMTLEEKIGQMTQVDITALSDPHDIAKYNLGSILIGGDSKIKENNPEAWADYYDTLQSYALKSRLRIPILFGADAVHGHNDIVGTVIFPHNIGMGCTGDENLVRKEGRVTAEEMAGTGINWDFAPCVAVARDPRWGRTYESYSEDPELVAKMGAAFIEGLQGTDLSNPSSRLACAKHYVGDGGTTNGIDQGNTECDEATLRRLFLPPYEAAIKSGVKTIMVSYSSWNGVKMSGNRYLLTDVLKKELGFNGFLVSDWAAIDQLGPDYKIDIERSVNAGLDMIMIPFGPGKKNNYIEFIEDLKELVNEGRVPIERINDAVRRILRVKFETGVFDHPFANKSFIQSIGSKSHREVARQCVRESLVLLKNNNGILPLKKNLKSILVAGKSANDIGNQCGGWTISWQGMSGDSMIKGGTTVLQAVKNAVSSDTKVIFSEDGTNAGDAQIAIVVIGETPYAEGMGDRKELYLSSDDEKVIERLKGDKIPIVTVLFSGRPLIINEALENSDAFIAAWLPGTEGEGITDVLFGDFRPTGKLSFTWPGNMNQVTLHKGDANYNPLFPFGFGLTY